MMITSTYKPCRDVGFFRAYNKSLTKCTGFSKSFTMCTGFSKMTSLLSSYPIPCLWTAFLFSFCWPSNNQWSSIVINFKILALRSLIWTGNLSFSLVKFSSLSYIAHLYFLKKSVLFVKDEIFSLRALFVMHRNHIIEQLIECLWQPIIRRHVKLINKIILIWI